jgi:hypothetical protein
MRTFIGIFIVLCFLVSFGGSASAQGPSQGPSYTAEGALRHPVMRPDFDTFMKWKKDRETAPRTYIDKGIELQLHAARQQARGTSLSLLGYLDYTPSERDQGYCGNCWVWAGTGVLEVADSVLYGTSRQHRHSIQLFNSCYDGDYACGGGNLTELAPWYAATAYSIPWANTHAEWQDGTQACAEAASSCRSCDTIAKDPNYPIASVEASTITTYGVGQSTAIANIKNVLNQNKAIYFAFWLASQADWDAFHNFWDQAESTLWTPDAYCGKTVVEGYGGHAVLLVGYNDDDADASKHYWIILNSWGSSAARPNGLFRMPMQMNYDCLWNWYGTNQTVRDFETLDVGTSSKTLSVTRAGTGTGTVTSSPAGIDCGTTCSYDFATGQSVTLTATAPAGSGFMGWSGDCSGTGKTCTVTMSAAKNVTATFSSCTYTLNSSSKTLPSFAAGNAVVSFTASDKTCPAPGATGNVGWVHAANPSYNQKTGKGTVRLTADANSSSSVSRSGTATIGDKTFTFAQGGKPCAVTLTPAASTPSIPKAGGSGTFAVSATPTDCAWAAAADALSTWAHVTAPGTGTGNGSVAYTVDANGGKAARNGKINVSYTASGRAMKKIFTVKQANK